jgi:hypothetical protein
MVISRAGDDRIPRHRPRERERERPAQHGQVDDAADPTGRAPPCPADGRAAAGAERRPSASVRRMN